VAATYFWLKKGAPPEVPADAASTPAARWSALARDYDAKIGMDELVMGVNLLRWWHVGSARGRVLEVCAGSARNLPYYDRGRVTSLTLADACPEMVAVARAKVEASKAKLPPTSVVVAAVDDLAPATTPATASGFDTVVDTFGLCSVPDPAAALRAMAAVLAPGGRLILIEHGRTNTWAWLDAQLDAGAAAHAAKWGCEWNRDILQAVAEAGLVVERVSRWHFGSTTVVYARPVEK
jgi:methyltransferase OMS1